MNKILFIVLMIFPLLHADLFVKGDKTVGIALGSGSVDYSGRKGTENYTILGVSGSYFIMNNLSVGIGYRHWFGGSPSVDEVTVPVTYFMPIDPKYRPYGGVFYRRVFMGSGYDDNNVYGVRAGLTIRVSPQSYIGMGWVQEYYDDCDQRGDCTSGYPEVLFSFSF